MEAWIVVIIVAIIFIFIIACCSSKKDDENTEDAFKEDTTHHNSSSYEPRTDPLANGSAGQAQANKKFCADCGAELNSNDLYCHNCGVQQDMSTQASEANKEHARTTNQSNDPPIRCPRCGSTNVHFITSQGGQRIDKKGACCGYLLCGPIGLLCGIKDKDTTTVRKCLHCNFEF